MSLVKELSIKDGKLYQYPVEAITSYVLAKKISLKKRQQLTLTSLNLTLKLTLKQNLSSSQTKKEMACHLQLILKTEKLSLTVLKLVKQYATDFGTSRECALDAGQAATANIFVDNSIVEIFFNKGEKVFTSRVFPSTEQTGIKVTSGNVSGHYFNLKY